ncbi:MAG: hypothetical protein ACEQSX_00395 [Baekduiaceae bacterium]
MTDRYITEDGLGALEVAQTRLRQARGEHHSATDGAIACALVAIAEHLTVAPETATAPVCGAQIVTRTVEGYDADVHVCVRRGGPCPWRARSGQVAGLKQSALSYNDDFTQELVDLPPCAEDDERPADG